MKTLKLTAASVALLFSVFTLSAQPQGGQQGGGRPQQGGQRGGQKEMISAEKMAEIKTDKMDQVLELSDSQEKKIYALNLDAAKEAVEMREAQKAEREAKMNERGEKKESAQKPERPSQEQMKAKQEEMKAKREEMKAKKDANELAIMKILDDEQKIKFAKMLAREEMRRAPQQGGKMQQGQGRPQQGGKMQQGQGRPQQGEKKQGEKPGQRPQPKKSVETTEAQAE
ncbi:MAG: hypothetical protein SNG10_06435 [Rikenellaceae bacterium]